MDNKIEHVARRLTVEEVKGYIDTVQKCWNEVDQRNLIMDLNPDYEFYQFLYEQDKWFLYAVETPEAVSMYSFLVQDALHTLGQKQVLSDFIYVDPKHRGTVVTDLLIKTAEEVGREKGATMMSLTLKEFDKHDSLVERLGFTHFENNFQKAI